MVSVAGKFASVFHPDRYNAVSFIVSCVTSSLLSLCVCSRCFCS
jgi:hypothetical protein